MKPIKKKKKKKEKKREREREGNKKMEKEVLNEEIQRREGGERRL